MQSKYNVSEAQSHKNGMLQLLHTYNSDYIQCV